VVDFTQQDVFLHESDYPVLRSAAANTLHPSDDERVGGKIARTDLR